MTEHDPASFAGGIAARLATRSRKVCLFIGAGAAKACGLPDISELEARVLEELGDKGEAAFTSLLEGRNFEEALSRLRRIESLLEAGGTIDGLSGEEAKKLDTQICQETVKALNIEQATLEPMRNLAAWIKRTDYHKPIEVFTVNYDLLLEKALEDQRAPYFDGFIGSLRGRFHTDLVEEWPGDTTGRLPATFARLWKLHGSVNWAWSEEESKREVVRLGSPVPGGRAAAIYPADTKYEESRRVPFVVLQDRFRRSLNKSETVVIISGYSFGDAHLNELLFEAAARRPRSELIAFCYNSIPEPVVERASRTPNLQAITNTEAIIGGKRGEWSSPSEPSPSFWIDGDFVLPDFCHLAKFLAKSELNERVGPNPRASDLDRSITTNEEREVEERTGSNGAARDV